MYHPNVQKVYPLIQFLVMKTYFYHMYIKNRSVNVRIKFASEEKGQKK